MNICWQLNIPVNSLNHVQEAKQLDSTKFFAANEAAGTLFSEWPKGSEVT